MLHPYMLTFIVLEGAMQTTGREKYPYSSQLFLTLQAIIMTGLERHVHECKSGTNIMEVKQLLSD